MNTHLSIKPKFVEQASRVPPEKNIMVIKHHIKSSGYTYMCAHTHTHTNYNKVK